jgi:dienelactone hydrolase
MDERRIATSRTARYYALGSGPVEEAWVVCHGYGQLARYFLRHFEAVAAPGRLIVAPEALSRFYMDDADGGGTYRRVGASWMTRDGREDEIADYARWLDTAYADALTRAHTPRPTRLVALGFSQGTATVARWLAASPMLPPHRCDRLILWGGTLPDELDLSAHGAWLSGRLTLVVGDQDPFATPERMASLEVRLRDHGIAYAVERYPGGHRLEADTLRRLAGGT